VPEKAGADKGLYVERASKESNNLQASQRPIFSSSRISFLLEGQEISAQHVPSRTGLSESESEQGRRESHEDSAQQQLLVREQNEARFGTISSLPKDLNVVVKWVLHLAQTSPGPNVKFEAIATIGVLVMNSEPHLERLM
jgi:hypothetical protein